MKSLLATFGVAVASAVFPLINIEAYIAGVNMLIHENSMWTVSLAAAAGQSVGKIAWYEVGRKSMHWGFVKRQMRKPNWEKQYNRAKRMTDQRPWAGMGLLAVSAVTGFPPLAVMAVLAGQLKFHRLWFYTITFLGRWARFLAVLGGIAWVINHSVFS